MSDIDPTEVTRAFATLERVQRAMQRAGPKPLPDGTLGYFAAHPRTDDCLRPCIATVLQIPPSHVPDPHLDERLAAGEAVEDIDASAKLELERWLEQRGLRMIVHERVPAARRRWIAVCRMLPWEHRIMAARRHQVGAATGALNTPFDDHCVVMSHDQFLHDPVDWVEHVLGIPESKVALWRLEHVTYGLTFQRVRRTKRMKEPGK